MSASARRHRPNGDKSQSRYDSTECQNGHPLSAPPTNGSTNRTVLTYQYEPEPCRFRIRHNKRRHLFRITGPDGETNEFDDRPVKLLVVEPDPKTGEFRPCFVGGKPKVIYLCWETKE